MKNRILFVNRFQYGYHIDSYKYCEYLKNTFCVSYIGWDFGLKKIESEDVTTSYISREGNKFARYYRFMQQVNKRIRTGNFDIVFIVYFNLASILKALNHNKIFIIDVRTGAVFNKKYKNLFLNSILKFECAMFNHVTIISKSLAELIGIEKYHLLPLGGESFSPGTKFFHIIHLLYVGTLQNRDIIECVKGFHQYLKSMKGNHKYEFKFTIIGDSSANELIEIRQYILDNGLEKLINAVGFIHNDKLHEYFEEATVGVSYIPIVSHYENQPPTKTYEYLLSGLPVIATRTKENAKILAASCGELIEDSAESFSMGLERLVSNFSSYKDRDIRSIYKDNLWKNIINNNLKPFILKLIEEKIPN